MSDAPDRMSYEGIDLTLTKNSTITVSEGARLDITGEVYINGELLVVTPPVGE